MVAIDPNQLGKAIHDLLHASDKGQVTLVLQRFPWLIRFADRQLTQVIVNNMQRNNLSGVAMYSAARGFLRRCNNQGTDSTLAAQKSFPLIQNGPLHLLLQLPEQSPPEHRIDIANRAKSDIDQSTEPEVYGLIMHNLGIGLLEQINNNQSVAYETAVSYFTEAVDQWQDAPIPFAQALIGQSLTNLAELSLRNPANRRQESIEKAFFWLQRAERVIPPQSTFVFHLLMLKGNAHLINPTGERLHNIELGITCYENALAIPKTDQQKRLNIKHNLAVAYRRRLAGDVAENYDQALKYGQAVIQETSPKSEQWARTSAELATIFANRRNGNRSNNLEEAIDHANRALEVYHPDSHPQQYTQTKLLLANIYCDRLEGNFVQNHLRAIQLFEDVLSLRNPENNRIGYAEAQNNLGTAYAALSLRGGDGNYQQAINSYQEALQIYQPDILPARRQNTASNWGNLAFRFGHWQEAHEAFQKAILAGNDLFGASGTESGRRVELAKSAGLSTAETYCLLKLKQPAAALEELERGRARQLAEALSLDAVNLKKLPQAKQQQIEHIQNKLKPLEFELRTSTKNVEPAFIARLGDEIKLLRTELKNVIGNQAELISLAFTAAEILNAIPNRAVLVAPVVTAKGTAVFIIPGSETAVSMKHVLWLDKLTSKHLATLLNGNDEAIGWINAYRDTENMPSSWKPFINQYAGKLWQQLMEPIHHRLAELKLPLGSSIILMPQGGLGLLPLHAAGFENDDIWQTFTDFYEVTYAPSAYALQMSQTRLKNRNKTNLLTVVNPTSKDPLLNLPNAPIEAHLVASYFDQTQHDTLVGNDAEKTAVIEAMTSQAYLHFCCHGKYNWQNVMDSCLMLANQDEITLADTLSHQVNLPNARLVTLSACETGITELDVAPDEYVGMPGGFMHAGASGVISSLWIVNDLSTAILMDQFYRNYFQEGYHPAKALRKAQIWLKQSTRAEISEHYFQRLSANENDQMLSSLVFDIERDGDFEERPFAHPYYWAAFTFNGS